MRRVTLLQYSFAPEPGGVTKTVTARLLVGPEGVEQVEHGDAESLLRVSVLDPKSGDPVTVETNPLRWADLLPTAFRTGDYTVSIETVGEPDPSASTSDPSERELLAPLLEAYELRSGA